MSGVFLSYSRADRILAGQVVRGLRALEVEVWWDEDMRGVDWQDELERQISALDAVVVLWTPNSVGSMHVKDEARLGRDNNKLINIMAGVPKPPFPFDSINGLPLDGWTGREPHPGWARAVETIEDLVVRAGGAGKGDFTTALARRDADVRRKQEAAAGAQEAFQDAQNRAGEAAEAAQAESAAFAHAQEVHRRVVELNAGSSVLRSAQDDLDKARAAKAEADKAERAAKSQLSAASRGLSRATAELNKLFSESVDPPEPDRSGPPAQRAAAMPDPVARPAPKAAPATVAEPIPKSNPDPTPAAGSAPPTKVAKARIPVLAWVLGALVVLVVLAALLHGRPSPAPVWPSSAQSSDSTGAPESGASAEDGAAASAASGAVASSAASGAAAEADAKGDAAAKAGDTKAAMTYFQQAADLGDARGETAVCDNDYSGQTGPRNFNDAFHWCRLAAAQGNVRAESLMGVMYEEGVGIGEPRNFTKALQWYRRAAAQGDTFAKGEIDNMYRSGQGVPKGLPLPY